MSSRYSRFLAACLIVFSLAPPLAHSQISEGWTVQDKTNALTLESVEKQDSLFKISFKNSSEALITAVSLSFDSSADRYQDWFGAEPSGLASGDIFSVSIGADECAGRKIRVTAVLFDDGSGKGEQVQLDRMNLHRFGRILETTRIKNLMQARKKIADDAAIEDLHRKVGKLPASAEDAFESLEGTRVQGIVLSDLKKHGPKTREAVLWGVSTTREGVLRHLEIAKQLPMNSKDEKTPSRGTFLSFVQDIYEKQNQKGMALIHRMQGGK